MLAVFGAITYRTTREYLSAAKWRTHSWQLLEVQQSFLRHLMEAENGVRGYFISNRESDLQPFLEARTKLLGEFASLELLSADRPAQRTLLDGISRLFRMN